MKEQLATRTQQRVKTLYRYTHAMECGDADIIAAILEEAQHDSILERMILEVNEVYQIEDRTVAHPDDVATAQEMLLTTFAERGVDMADARSAPETVRDGGDEDVGKLHSVPETGTVVPLQLSARRIPPRKWYRSRVSWLTGAVAAILIVLLLVPSAGALADQFLSLFRVQQFQPVTVQRPEQLVSEVASLLRNFGSVQWDSSNQPLISPVASNDVKDVEKLVNFQPQLPTSLPDGVGKVAQFSVSSGENVTFTFDEAKAESYLQTTGQGDITIPASLKGAKFDVKLSSGLAVIYYDHCQAPAQDGRQDCTSGKVSLALGEIPSPVINAEGDASFSDLHAFLLSLPKLSPDLHNLIAHIDVNSGVIPVPIPSGVNAQQVDINGAQGLALSYDKAGLIVWQDHELVFLITAYGSDTDQLLNTAKSFR
jgi:hypothetical protein